MNFDEFWKDCTSSEKDLFQKSCRRLLKSTFIVRDKDEEKLRKQIREQEKAYRREQNALKKAGKEGARC